jgi:hypothetical protein
VKQPFDDLPLNAQAVAQDFLGQREYARREGESMGKVTVFVNRMSHRFPAGQVNVEKLRPLARGRRLFMDGRELLDDSEILTLVGGEAFSTE